MKIALLSYEYPPDTGFGGIGTHTWYQARALARLGHEVQVVAGSLVAGVHRSEHDGVRVLRVLDEDLTRGAVAGLQDDGLPWAADRLRTGIGAYRVVRDLLERESFDVVEYPDCGADGAFASGLPVGLTSVRFHSPAQLIMGSYGALDRDVELTTILEQLAIDRADVRISPSRFLADEVTREMAVPGPVHLVPNGIDLDLFDRDEGLDVVDRFGLPPRPSVTILFSGRIEQRKGADLLPEVCDTILHRYPHVHVVLAGEDPHGAVDGVIRPRLDRAGSIDRLHVLGRRSLVEVRAILKHVDIHLHPATWDNAPYSCIEAMAAGRPIVASDVGGLPELIDHGRTGLLAGPGDAGSFVEALGELIEDREKRERFGAAARRKVEADLTDVAMARRSVEIWRGSRTA